MNRCMAMLIGVATLGLGVISTNAQVDETWMFEGSEYMSPDWTLVNSAHWTYEYTDRLRLTSKTPSTSGSAWLNTDKVEPGADWEVYYRGSIHDHYTFGADAMNFIFQTQGLSAGGAAGPAWLYVELDTYSGRHLNIVSSLGNVGSVNVGDALELGGYFSMYITNANNTISLCFDHDARAPVYGSWAYDLDTVFSGTNNEAWVGFNAWCGADAEKHDLVQVSIHTTTAIPEPTTLALLILSLGSLLYLRRRHR